MGAIEDTRMIIQELVAPDLKAIDARLTSLEKHADTRFSAVGGQLEKLEIRLERLEDKVSSVDSRLHALDGRLQAFEAKIDGRIQALEAKIDANQQIAQALLKGIDGKLDGMLNALNLDRRLQHLERERSVA